MNLFALVNGAPWIFGPVTFAGTITFTGSALIADGSAAAPALAFAADTDTGIYRPGANEIAFVTGGTERASFISQGLKLSNVGGSFTVPNVFANGDNDTGLATIGGNQLALVVGGATALSFNNSINATIGGNLTVSGTGTSSVAGVFQVGPLSPLNQLDVSKSGTTNRVSVQVGTGDNGIHFIDNGGTRYTIGSSIGLYAPGDYFAFNRYSGSAWTEMGRFAPSGNLLIGTNIDGGQKLQVSGTTNISSDLTNYGKRTLRGNSSNPDAANVPVACEFSKSTGNTAATTATVVITGTLGACNNWREALVEVYASGCNIYSGTEGSVNELVQFQHASNTALNPRNFTVVRTNAAGSAITIAYAGTGPTTFTITVTKTDASVPGVVPSQELWVTVKVTASTTVSLA